MFRLQVTRDMERTHVTPALKMLAIPVQKTHAIHALKTYATPATHVTSIILAQKTLVIRAIPVQKTRAIHALKMLAIHMESEE